jgi:hypothetical protein
MIIEADQIYLQNGSHSNGFVNIQITDMRIFGPVKSGYNLGKPLRQSKLQRDFTLSPML